MKRIFAALLLFTAMGAQAASVTIDFEEPISFTDEGNYGSLQSQFQSKGYLFTARAYGSTPEFDPVINQSSGNRYFYMYDQPGFVGGCGGCTSSYLRVQRSDGGAFAVESADIDPFVFDPGNIEIWGLTGSGASVQLSLNTIGSGDWLNLSEFEIQITEADAYALGMDDIVVSAVPIPAAAWLFGSALAGLGWVRRHRNG